MALRDAAKKGLVCVQVSDDISKWEYYDVGKVDLSGQTDFSKANNALLGSRKHVVSPLAAAQFMLAKMRAAPEQAKLAGVCPTPNAAMTIGAAEFGHHHFILGDFFVADLSPVRFDETMTLKEDYDFSCSHIAKHGSVLRCNRMIVHARHLCNEGGAVASRDSAGVKERANIAILQRKWPGVFKLNIKRNHEVLMRWRTGQNAKDKMLGSTKHAAAKKPTLLKRAATNEFKPEKIIARGSLTSSSAHIRERVKGLLGKKVGNVLGQFQYEASSGDWKTYCTGDLRYDLKTQVLGLH
jgi:hypothetical protein